MNRTVQWTLPCLPVSPASGNCHLATSPTSTPTRSPNAVAYQRPFASEAAWQPRRQALQREVAERGARPQAAAGDGSYNDYQNICIDINEEKLFNDEMTELIGYRCVVIKIYRSTAFWLFETANKIGDQIGCSLAIIIGKLAGVFPDDLINMSTLSDKKDMAYFTSPRVEVKYNDDMAMMRINDDDNDLLTTIHNRFTTINFIEDVYCKLKRTMKMDGRHIRYLNLNSEPFVFTFDQSRMDIYWLLFYTYNSSLDIRLRVGRYEQRLVFRSKDGIRYKLPQPISKLWLLLTSLFEFKLKGHTPEQTIKENELSAPSRILISSNELTYISNWFASKLSKWRVSV